MNDDKDLHDPELHDQEISALYRQLPDEAPSADTDALIHAAARRAVSAAPRTTIFTVRSQRLLATAATMVLGIGLLAQWQREPEKLQEMVATTPAQSAATAVETLAPPPSRSINMPDSVAPATITAPEKRKPISVLQEETPPKPAPVLSAASSAGAVAAAPAPVQERREEHYFLEREMAKKSLAADSAVNAEAENEPARTRAIARAGMEADALQKQAPAAASPHSRLAAKNETKANARIELQDYRQAMQTGNWGQAEIALGMADANESPQQRTDRHLLASLQKKTPPQPCTDLPASEALLCQFISLQEAGKPLPEDALAQLEKSGAISGALAYRRTAVIRLLEKP